MVDRHAAPAPPRRRASDSLWRALLSASSYGPILIMAALAGASWWLVKNAPSLDAASPAAQLRHVPDYTMERFTVQRFNADGSLKAQLEGRQVRHYPDTDTLEVDDARIRLIAQDGRLTMARARLAVSNADGSQLQLKGGAHVVQQSKGGEAPIDFRGEFLQVFMQTEQVRSHLPVVVTRGATELHADTLDVDNLEQQVRVKGRVRATFVPRGASRPSTGIEP